MLLQRLSQSLGACVALGFLVGILLTLGFAGPLAWMAGTTVPAAATML